MTNDQIKKFLKGGRATFTLESLKTGKHYTFKAGTPKDKENPIFISVLSDGEDNYNYLGTVWVNEGSFNYQTSRKSPMGHPLHKVLNWYFQLLTMDKTCKDLVFRHAGKCSRCGRKLTTPESIDAGMGPVCSGKVA